MMHGRNLSNPLRAPSNGLLAYAINTDYESDSAYLSDMPQSTRPPIRSNEELNLSVCRRHNPDITNVITHANYAVIYDFNTTTSSWEKIGVEGTLFVCQLKPGKLDEARYTVFLLNRRGLQNFNCPLTGTDNVEITDQFIILKRDNENNQSSEQQADCLISGIWIFGEPDTSTSDTRTATAKVISDCAATAGRSLKDAMIRARAQAIRQTSQKMNAAAAEAQGEVPTSRTQQLDAILGQQRAQDDEWSVRTHQGQLPQQPQYHPQALLQQQPSYHPQGLFQQQQQQLQRPSYHSQAPAQQQQLQRPSYHPQPPTQAQAQAQAQAEQQILQQLLEQHSYHSQTPAEQQHRQQLLQRLLQGPSHPSQAPAQQQQPQQLPQQVPYHPQDPKTVEMLNLRQILQGFGKPQGPPAQ